MPLGRFLDQWNIYREYHGLARPSKPTKAGRSNTIDDVFPPGLL